MAAAKGSMLKNKRAIWVWCSIVTVVVEAITLWLRFGRRVEANEFNRSAPLLLQFHHMFWSLPLFAIAAILRNRPPIAAALVGIGMGLIVSDLAHHFLVLPLIVGNTGWHWP
jgi:hypothetical protein